MVRRMIRRWHDRERQRLRRALNHPAASAWENLGLWSRADQPYGEAAHALAMRVGAAAGLQPGDSVLDIGPGHGDDQQELWRNEFAIGHYYGWERSTPAPKRVSWQHVVAVDSAYFVPRLWQRWQRLWPQVVAGGTITWTDLYLKQPVASWRWQARLRLTSALAGIPWHHWRTLEQWLGGMRQWRAGVVEFEDLTDEVLGGFVRHMAWRRDVEQPSTGLGLANATVRLLAPLLEDEVIGYGLFQIRRDKPPPETGPLRS